MRVCMPKQTVLRVEPWNQTIVKAGDRQSQGMSSKQPPVFGRLPVYQRNTTRSPGAVGTKGLW